jgi:hypothetical protein
LILLRTFAQEIRAAFNMMADDRVAISKRTREAGWAAHVTILAPARAQGAVNRTTKKYKGIAPRMNMLKAEMKVLRADWAKKVQAKAAARR